MNNFHICNLCGNLYKKKKPNSHIIPKQLFNDFKKRNNWPKFASSVSHNIMQREPVEFFLCDECEKKFNPYETEFAKLIKNPIYSNNVHKLIINDDIKMCLLSIFWRIIKCWHINKKKYGKLNNFEINKLLSYELNWKDALVKENVNLASNFHSWIFPIDWLNDDEFGRLKYFRENPGFIADFEYHDQGNHKGYFTFYCLVDKLLLFASDSYALFCKSSCSTHRNEIDDSNVGLPLCILDRIYSYYCHIKERKNGSI